MCSAGLGKADECIPSSPLSLPLLLPLLSLPPVVLHIFFFVLLAYLDPCALNFALVVGIACYCRSSLRAIVGTQEFINRVKWFRKMFGGGVRQSGAMAAAADHAITHHFPRMAGTHRLAKRLEQGLRDAGCDILAPVDTNMVSRRRTV